MQDDLTPEVSEQPPPRYGVLAEPRFRRFALAKTLQLTGQNALVYGLFIAFITEQSTYIAGSAFVLATVLPSVFLSVPGGLVADRLPNKAVLLSVLLIRGAIIWQFIDADLSLQAVILLTFLTFAFTMVAFRAEDGPHSLALYGALFSGGGFGAHDAGALLLVAICALPLLVTDLLERRYGHDLYVLGWPWPARAPRYASPTLTLKQQSGWRTRSAAPASP